MGCALSTQPSSVGLHDVLVTLGAHVGEPVLMTSKVDDDRTLVVFGKLDGVEARKDGRKATLVFDQGAQYYFLLRGRRQGERAAAAPARIAVSRGQSTTFVAGVAAVEAAVSFFAERSH